MAEQMLQKCCLNEVQAKYIMENFGSIIKNETLKARTKEITESI